jgi:hypothetical protein
MPRSIAEVVVMDGRRSGMRNMLLGAVTKLGFLAAMVCLARKRRTRASISASRLAFVAACLAVVPLTIIAAYYQFGSECCERHYSLRQCMVFLGLGAAAPLVAALMDARLKGRAVDTSRAASWSMRCLLLALVVAASQSSGRLKHDLRRVATIREAQTATWVSGQSDSASMTVVQFRPGEVVGGNGVHPPGAYPLDGPPPEELSSMLTYFSKRSVIVGKSLPDSK